MDEDRLSKRAYLHFFIMFVVMTLILVTIPLYLLYKVSISVAMWVGKAGIENS